MDLNKGEGEKRLLSDMRWEEVERVGQETREREERRNKKKQKETTKTTKQQNNKTTKQQRRKYIKNSHHAGRTSRTDPIQMQ